MIRIIKNLLLFPFKLVATFFAFFKWYNKNTSVELERLKERHALEREAADLMAPYMDEIKKYKDFDPMTQPACRTFSPVYEQATGNPVVMPFTIATDFVTSYHIYWNTKSHAHAKQAIEQMDDDKIILIGVNKEEAFVYDRAAFETLLTNYYNVYHRDEEIVKEEEKRKALEAEKKKFWVSKAPVSSAALEGSIGNSGEDENGLV